MNLVCITNQAQHRAGCPGFLIDAAGRRWDGKRYALMPCTGCARRVRSCVNKGKHRITCFDLECRGCEPRQADQGFLCWHCWAKLVDGFGHLTDLITHMRSVAAAGSVDANTNVSSSFGSKWPLSESHLMANAIYVDLVACAIAYANDWDVDEPDWGDPLIADLDHGFGATATPTEVYLVTEQLVSWLEPKLDKLVAKPNGAARAVELVQSVAAAGRRFTMAEEPHAIPYMRCAQCGHAQLRWEPPYLAGSEVKIECERCGHKHSHEWYDEYLENVRHSKRPTPEKTFAEE